MGGAGGLHTACLLHTISELHCRPGDYHRNRPQVQCLGYDHRLDGLVGPGGMEVRRLSCLSLLHTSTCTYLHFTTQSHGN